MNITPTTTTTTNVTNTNTNNTSNPKVVSEDTFLQLDNNAPRPLNVMSQPLPRKSSMNVKKRLKMNLKTNFEMNFEHGFVFFLS